MAQPGLILKRLEKNKGAKGSVVTGSKREPLKDPTPTYKDYGLSQKTAMVAQQLAMMPAELREDIANRERTYNEPRREQQRAKEVETIPSLPI